MNNLFNGDPIWGSITQEDGPTPRPRVQRSPLPGVSGFRSYILGVESVVYSVRGLVYFNNLADLQAFKLANAAYCGTGLWTFRCNDGTLLANCLLTDYRPASPVEAVILDTGLPGVCQWMAGTIEWTTPDW